MRGRPVLLWLGLVVGVVVLGWVAGFVFGQSAPEVAARQVVREFIALDPVTLEVHGPDVVAPASGGNDGTPRCGRVASLSIDDEVATLDAGRVIVHVRSPADATRAVTALNDEPRETVTIVVDERIDAPVVATAWGVRMALDAVDAHLLSAFLIGYSGQRGPLPACS